MAKKNDETNKTGAAPKRGRPSKYSPLYVDALLAYADRARREVAAIEKCQTRDGIKFYQPPSSCVPSLADFAATIACSRESIRRWREEHEDFREACEIASTAFESVATRMLLLGAWNPSIGALLLKNAHAWRDKADLELSGGVTLRFDAQDETA